LPTIYEVVIDYFLRGGVIVSILIFAYQVYRDRTSKKKESKERLCRVCKTLKVQVDELDEWYKSNQYQALKTRHYTTEYSQNYGYVQKNEYFQNIINTAIYDGIVNSGLITYLKEETQTKLNKYYAYAALHNKRMFHMAQIYNDKASSSEFKFEDIGKLTSSFAWGLNEAELTRYESEMQKLLPELKELLDKEIENAEKS
jgi:hypothetical protein